MSVKQISVAATMVVSRLKPMCTYSYLLTYLKNKEIMKKPLKSMSAVIVLSIYIGMPLNALAGPFDSFIDSVKAAIPTNLFDSTGADFNKLVDANEFEKANSLFDTKYASYFDKQFSNGKNEVTPQLQKLGKWNLDSKYASKINDIGLRLLNINQLAIKVDGLWIDASSAIRDGEKLIEELTSSDVLRLSKVADVPIVQIKGQLDRVYSLAKRDRNAAFVSTFDSVFSTGAIDGTYPLEGFRADDYVKAVAFQNKILNEYLKILPAEQTELLKRLENVTSSSLTNKIARDAKLKESLAAIGSAPYSLEKLSLIRNAVKEFGNDSGLQNAVKIGYLDLTASSFKDRNIFDFELAFEKDYGLDIQDAKDDVLAKNSISSYDYIFVTDLSIAKILREFKNKREIGSKTQSGTKQEQNPEYVTALSDYQRAMTDMQSTKMQNAATANQPCYGSVIQCVLLAGLKGASNGASENTFKQKSDLLAKTSQTVTKPVYSSYNYQLVDISAAKIARVDYYVIDVRKKLVYSNYFEIKDAEKFTVSYNLEEGDPDSSSIMRNNRREEDVTAWEKKPVSVKLSALFEPKNISQNGSKPFVSVESFLKPLTSRQYVSASPTYGSSATNKGDMKNSSTSRSETGAIADERFDSVLIIKTSKAVGTGFYVTPDLVLTAYHVVDGANLVEMTFYDGTKTFGKVVDSDVRLDLALVKAQAVGKPVKIHSGQIRLGETAEAIGHPKGYEFTITRGVVSAIRKQAGAVLKAGPPIEFVQTDTPISPGNSGGPLFIKDYVIGVNDWVRVDKASQNLNFSVSYNEIRDYLNRFEGKK